MLATNVLLPGSEKTMFQRTRDAAVLGVFSMLYYAAVVLLKRRK